MGGHMKLLALAAALVIAACAHAPSHDLGAGARYVNMGSSFAAGAGTGPAPEGSPARCYQSSVSYAHLLAARRNLALTDVSCGGATSAHLLNAWNELPPQIEAITADTRLVTITIGGNDVAYAGNLTQASCEQGEMIRVGTFAVPCPTTPFPVAADAFDNLERNLGEITRQIKTRAPNARVIFIQYVTLAPQIQCANSRFTEAEAAELRATAAACRSHRSRRTNKRRRCSAHRRSFARSYAMRRRSLEHRPAARLRRIASALAPKCARHGSDRRTAGSAAGALVSAPA
jgi:lysophospholipase L1-like esterase